MPILISLFLSLTAFPALAAPIRVGYSALISSAGYFIAMERGYFKEYGLEVEGTPFRGNTAAQISLLATGKLEVGGLNVTAGLWNANSENEQIKLVADKGTVAKDHEYVALLVRSDLVKEGKFKSLKDLKGKKMAFTAMGGTSQEIVTERFLKKAGLTPEDVTYVKMSYPDMNAAFRTKQLDATMQVEPYVTMAVLEGIAVKEGSVYDVYPDQPSGALFYSAKFAKERPGDATKFMAAYLRGVRDYNAAFGPQRKDRAEIVAIMKKYTEPLTDEVWEKMAPVGLNPDGYMNKEALAKDVEWFRAHKYVDKVLPVDQLVDHSFVDGALKMIGKAAQPGKPATPAKPAKKKAGKAKK